MISNFTITPYVSVGPITFEMNRNQLHGLLGAPDRSKKSKMGSRVTDYWFKEDVSINLSAVNGCVEEISFGAAQSEAEIDRIKIFQGLSADIYRTLCLKDSDPRVDVGITVLFRLGITLDGFLVTDQEQRVVTAFAYGIWNENDEDLKRIQIS